jgi:hypothetical protein
MNDFTKEELETISSWGNVYTEFGEHFTFKLHKPLIDKITSLIDNYCMHDEGIGIDYPAEKCLKCGACLGW